MTEQKKISVEEKKVTRTLFILFFPFMIVALIAIGSTKDVLWATLVIACTVYGLIMLKQFIDDYYKK